jgi:hypothetical protein
MLFLHCVKAGKPFNSMNLEGPGKFNRLKLGSAAGDVRTACAIAVATLA